MKPISSFLHKYKVCRGICHVPWQSLYHHVGATSPGTICRTHGHKECNCVFGKFKINFISERKIKPLEGYIQHINTRVT
jgi:hypothetical protein